MNAREQVADATGMLLRPPEAAERLSICERKLWGLTAPRGPIPCVRIGRSVRYAPGDLAEYVRRTTEAAPAT